MTSKNLEGAIKFRELIRKYNTVFEGVVLPSQWPEPYQKVFRDISNIDRIFYEEQISRPDLDQAELSLWKERVEDLRLSAYICRRQLANEATWRSALEHKVVKRFESKLNCSQCGQRLWAMGLLESSPTDTDSERRSKRAQELMHSRCGARAQLEDHNESSAKRLFESQCDTRVVYFEEDRPKENGLPEQYPDRVYGLAKTKSFERVIDLGGNLKHSSFAGSDLIYPFLVIEAKAEKNNPGFESIEAQTAFPIRTFLKLQENLVRNNNASFQPLVWFFAHVGDSWRVYGCIADLKRETRFRIFELWEGTLLSHDKAFRLLLIVDYICDWALKYRRRVYKILRQDHDRILRDLTPAFSVLSTQNDPSSPSEDGRLFVETENDGQLPRDASRIVAEDTQMSEIVTLDSPDEEVQAHSSASYLSDGDFLVPHPDGTQTESVVRHIDQVRLRFVRFWVPDSLGLLRSFLGDMEPHRPVQNVAADFIAILRKAEMINTTSQGIEVLQNTWLGKAVEQRIKNDGTCCAWVVFNTYFDSRDCQLIRQLTCITTTRPGLQNLLNLAGMTSHTTFETPHRCECLMEAALSLRNLARKDAAISAFRRRNAYLALFNEHFGWKARLSEDSVNEVHNEILRLHRTLTEATNDGARKFTTTDSVERELLPGRRLPLALRDSHTWDSTFHNAKSIVLLAETGPVASLLVVDSRPTGDREVASKLYADMLSEIVNTPKAYSRIFFVLRTNLPCESNFRMPLKKMLQKWLNRLRAMDDGQIASDR